MGGKSSPDFGTVAVAQGQENDRIVQNQLNANRPDQYTPWGYTNWTQEDLGDGDIRYTQTQGLTPEMQEELNKQVAIQSGKSDVAGSLVGRMGDEFGQQMDWSGLSPMGGVPEAQFTQAEGVQNQLGDPTAMRSAAENAVYDKGASRLDDQFAGQREALEVKMRNQGLNPEDQAWQAQMTGLDQSETDAYGQLQYDAVTQGQSEQNQAWGQGMDAGQFYNAAGQQTFGQNQAANQQNFGQASTQSNMANQLRQQQMTEEMTQRGFSLNEINALMSGSQVGLPQMPSFSQGESAAPAPLYQGAADQASINAANNPMNALLGAAGTAGGAYLGTL